MGKAGIFLLLLIPVVAVQAFQGAKSDVHPASVGLSEFIKAFNSGSQETMREFYWSRFAKWALQQSSVEDRVNRYAATKSRVQSLRLQKIVAEQAFQTFALVNTGSGEDFLLRANVEKEPPHRLLFIFWEPVDDPGNLVVPDPKKGDAELVSAARSFLEARARAGEFSGVVLIARNSDVLFHEAYGYADREKKIANRKDTKFNLGSINKNFTRVAVLQLEKQGKLSLRDPVKKFLPDYPNRDAAEKVTIQHLLDMTSGIGDFFGPRYNATPKEKIRSLKDYLPLFADHTLEFEPGTNNRYSNGGYVVLGLIIEKASGLNYYDYVRENVFIPAGMVETESYERDAAVPNLARGYTRRGRAGKDWILNLETLPGRGSSAGGGYSTAGDLLKYIAALHAGKLHLSDIGNGLSIAGGAPGINATLDWDTQKGYIVIALSNFDPSAAGNVVRRILSWLPE